MFVDAAALLIAQRGYDALSIQDVLNATGASKGAFYHYFESKEDLLNAVVAQTADRVGAAALSDGQREGVDRLQDLYHRIASAKRERTQLIQELAAVWYSDGNAVMRERAREAIRARITPLLEQIIEQGVRRGDFQVADPETTAQIVTGLILDFNDSSGRPGADLDRMSEAHEAAVVRVLALQRPVRLIDRDAIDNWKSERK